MHSSPHEPRGPELSIATVRATEARGKSHVTHRCQVVTKLSRDAGKCYFQTPFPVLQSVG